MRQPEFRAVDPARSRVVMIGTPHYRHAGLPDVPVIAANVAGLAEVLTDPELGRFDARHCVVAPPDADLATIGEILTAASDAASDLLLVYYSGHGLIDRRGKLYLSLADTRPDQLAYSALAFDAIRETFLDGRADNRVVILDSCFSGRAIGRPLAGEEQAVLAALEVKGTFTLTSATANSVAMVLDGERHTAFTERLLRLFQQGSPKAGQMLTMPDVYRHLRSQLRSEGLPEPQQCETNAVEMLGLIRNRQVGTARQWLVSGLLPTLSAAAATGRPTDAGSTWQTSPGDVVSGEDVAAMAIDRGLRTVSRAGSKQMRRLCLGPIAPVVAAVDEHQALGLVASVSDNERRESILKDIAVVVAAADDFRGMEIARPLQEAYRGPAFARIAAVSDRLHRGNGEYFLDLEILGGTPPRRWTPSVLGEIAVIVAEFAPDRAESIAIGISDRGAQINALSGIAGKSAASDPDRTVRIVERLIEDKFRAWVGEGKYPGWMAVSVASAAAAVDPDRALKIIAVVAANGDAYHRGLLGIARAVARTEPDRALAIADGNPDRRSRAEALTAVAIAVAGTDFDAALGIISTIGSADVEQAALADLLPALATSDPEAALRRAEGIADGLWQVHALSGIASVLLGIKQTRSGAIGLAASTWG